MSVRGTFEIDPACDPDDLLARVRVLGFPNAELERVEGFKKPYILDLQAFARPDAGGGSSVPEDLVQVAKYLVEHARDHEVYYCQELDIRNPDHVRVIHPDEIKDYPPSMDGLDTLFLVRS